MITKDNYEAYLLDLYEGTLSAQDKVALYDFLEENPELSVAIEEENLLQLYPEPTKEFDKNKLLFDAITKKNYSHFFIAYVENQLSIEEKNAVEKFVHENPELTTEFNQFKATVLKAPSITFNNKQALLFEEKTAVLPLFAKYTMRIAAVFILSFLAYQFIPEATEANQIVERPEIDTTPSSKDNIAENKVNKINLTHSDILNEQPTAKIATNTPLPAPVAPHSKTKLPLQTKDKDAQSEEYSEKEHHLLERNVLPKEVLTNEVPKGINSKKSPNLNTLIAHLSTTEEEKQINNEEITPRQNNKNQNNLLGLGEFALAKAKDKLTSEDNLIYGFSREINSIVEKTEFRNTAKNDKKTQKIKLGGFSFERTAARN